MASQRILIVVAALVAGTVAPAVAQEAPLTLEIHGGAAIPFGDLAEGGEAGTGTDPGPTLAVRFALASTGWRTLYAGFSQHRFECRAEGCPPDDLYRDRYVATGFNVGLRIVPVRSRRITPWIGIGGITTRVETRAPSAIPEDIDREVSDLGFGVEGGVGLSVRLGGSFDWSAAGLASWVDTTLPNGSSLPLRFVSVQTGITLLF